MKPAMKNIKTESPLAALFALHCRANGLVPIKEFKFHHERQWRFDFAFPLQKCAVEVEGGIWTNGRHTRGSGFIADMEKYNHAAAAGWYVFRFDGDTIKRGEAILFIKDVIEQRNAHAIRAADAAFDALNEGHPK
jgi:very-short-patch-repair endonuclease